MKSGVLYFGLTAAVVFFAIKVFATGGAPTNYYDQLTDQYGVASKIPDLDKLQGVWSGTCYARTDTPDRRVPEINVEAFIGHWHWDPPHGSPLKPIDSVKFQIRPATTNPTGDWNNFLSGIDRLPAIEEFYDEHTTPNTWAPYFSQTEWKTSREADLKIDKGFLYVWMRSTSVAHWACFLTFNSLP